MPNVDKAEILQRIEHEVRTRLAPGTSEENAARWIGFEMASVDIHRTNLVPFVRGHGARRGHRVLDFGSGPGASACAMALELGVEVVGVEPNHENEAIAPLWAAYTGVADRVSFVFSDDTLHLPFPDESFDFVLASSVLEYVQGDRGPFLREMWRVLKRGGRLLVAGTSNAVWPREVHSRTWTINWMPNLGPRLRSRLLKKTGLAERGITFGEIEAALPGARFVRGSADQLDAFAARFTDKVSFLPDPARRGITTAVRGALARVNQLTEEGAGWPAEAFLPWLNVAFERTA